jgi:ADP-ribosyl-[dinitrogen reductase] hydrolase
MATTPPAGGSPERRDRRSRSAFRGCLLGGAVGDALGAPIEFDSLAKIRARHGRAGVTDLADGSWPAGSITDDTQMTLFTAEALIRGRGSLLERGLASASDVARGSYLRWLATQGERVGAGVKTGWLVTVPELHARRAPGNTCLSALSSGGRGTPDQPANDSKGCGGVMRVAPVGLALEEPFPAASAFAAITHGHPTGHLAAAYLAQLVRELRREVDLRDAALRAAVPLRAASGRGETLRAVEGALSLAARARGTPEEVESLGGGWVAEEALAIGLFCALVARDFAHGVLLAVNHGGDSDSTGSIAGNLLGLVAGEEGIPGRWLARLELREVIAQVADDLWSCFGDAAAPPADAERYPPS